jgi:hypothetical protein
MRRFPLVCIGLVLALLAGACASTGIGKAVQAADAQKQLVERAAIEFVKLKKQATPDPRITDAIYAQGREAYEKYQVAQGSLAQALSSWKVVASPENESKLQAALVEATKTIDSYLALVGKFVNLEELKKKLNTSLGAPTPVASWSEIEDRAALRLAEVR